MELWIGTIRVLIEKASILKSHLLTASKLLYINNVFFNAMMQKNQLQQSKSEENNLQGVEDIEVRSQKEQEHTQE
ncbi:4760_t:CDS:2 [Funneliformis mosseae]|uniref:4760_t:CDS:1 n=1 Tax=Funneliformis mosseae TaxID=27381 RepID=A0A9N9CWF9_FUNMO|nr:4760_t:CDS:2 [Funneliformis mosseae]